MWLSLLLTACGPEVEDTAFVSDLHAGIVDDLYNVIEVQWSQPEATTAWLEYRVEGGEVQQTPPRARPSGSAALHIVGVPYEADISVSLVVEGSAETHVSLPMTVQTERLPDSFPMPELITNTADAWDPSAPFLLNSTHEDPTDWSSVWWIFIMDRDGAVRWAYRSDNPDGDLEWVSRHISLTFEQDAILLDRATAWTEFDHGEQSTIARMTLDGTVHHVYETPGLHHPFTSRPGGIVAWAARDLANPSYESIEEVDEAGVQTHIWSCPEAEQPSCGSNTLWWDEAQQRYLFSFWSNETIVEVDAASGRMIRSFGQTNSTWPFSTESTPFAWQHGPNYTTDGTLLVSSEGWDINQETIAIEYALDEETEQLVEIWRGHSGHHGKFGGDVWRLPGGNTLHGVGSGSYLVEYDPAGQIIWEARWTQNRRIGQTSLIEDLYDLVP